MYKKKLLIVLIFIIPRLVFGHTLMLNVKNNKDGTIQVQGIYNTGQLASGAEIRIESLVSGELLYKKRLPDTSELNIPIPKEPYQVVLDGGPEGQLVKLGIAPVGGFTKELTQNKKSVISQPREEDEELPHSIIVAISIAFILLFITIFISIKNTNKLMKELKKAH